MSYEFADGYKIRDQKGLYFLTFTVEGWIDLFSRQRYRDILIRNMEYCRKNKGLAIGAFVIMTNHVHCILSAKNENLSNVIRDWKHYTSTHTIKAIQSIRESRQDWLLKRFEFAAKSSARNSRYQFWQHDNHAMELVSRKFFNQKLNYIHLNPVRAGWVENAEDWLYSSARNYMYLSNLMEVDLLDINF